MKGEVYDGVALRMDECDDVATALTDLDVGRELAVDDRVTLVDDVPFGHKFALRRFDGGDEIHKYGEVIGVASQVIEPGEWIHTHNCESRRGRGDEAAGGGLA